MIRFFSILTVFAVSLMATPIRTGSNIIPFPGCDPNCPYIK